MPDVVRVITFAGIAGETRWDAFRGWATRVRRHVGWRLIRPELDQYVDQYASDEIIGWSGESREHAWHTRNALESLREWVRGPAGWDERPLWLAPWSCSRPWRWWERKQAAPGRPIN